MNFKLTDELYLLHKQHVLYKVTMSYTFICEDRYFFDIFSFHSSKKRIVDYPNILTWKCFEKFSKQDRK